jgi:hypothetical protein
MRNRNRKIAMLEFTRGATVVGDDIESIGRKLDNVRGVLNTVYPDTWAHRFWRQVESQLMRKMNLMLIR